MSNKTTTRHQDQIQQLAGLPWRGLCLRRRQPRHRVAQGRTGGGLQQRRREPAPGERRVSRSVWHHDLGVADGCGLQFLGDLHLWCFLPQYIVAKWWLFDVIWTSNFGQRLKRQVLKVSEGIRMALTAAFTCSGLAFCSNAKMKQGS